jgi:hypothetical protein
MIDERDFEQDFEKDLVRLGRMKTALWRLSLVIVITIFSHIGLLVWVGIGTLVQLRRQSSSEYVVDLFAAYLLLSLALFFLLAGMIIIFERLVRSARILSGEFADAIGWYNYTPSHPRAPEFEHPSYKADSDSGYLVRKGRLVQARVLMREIAENSSLPLLRSESASFLYIVFSLFLLLSQSWLTYMMISR